MFLTTLIITTLLTSYVVSDTCVTYNFEENFDDIVGSYGICSGIPAWVLDEYSRVSLNSPDERSTKFITPTRASTASCWSSFVFTVDPGSKLQLKTYMDLEDRDGGNINVFVVVDGTGIMVGMDAVNSANIKGWYTWDVPLFPSVSTQVYISIMGMTSASSTVLVDSFRYIPPGTSESSCQIY
ncbi:uncharacterized protein LOC111355055 [Spodoptera litura]|uniref:Uncharacterized protein LOC111355055 n=1 Tax=Spodoptera litura TaxID=69820 RepID=A0A9J7E971_SPOLT|nr:uncharacterized protein LOC111355055 [Spodoptera litura]